MSAPSGFELEQRKNGEVVITHHGKRASVLRGDPAERLLSGVESVDEIAAQHLMARATGNYKRRNERQE